MLHNWVNESLLQAHVSHAMQESCYVKCMKGSLKEAGSTRDVFIAGDCGYGNPLDRGLLSYRFSRCSMNTLGRAFKCSRLCCCCTQEAHSNGSRSADIRQGVTQQPQELRPELLGSFHSSLGALI